MQSLAAGHILTVPPARAGLQAVDNTTLRPYAGLGGVCELIGRDTTVSAGLPAVPLTVAWSAVVRTVVAPSPRHPSRPSRPSHCECAVEL